MKGFRKNTKVFDDLFGTGQVIKVLKTKLHIKFNNHQITTIYDIPHIKHFLKRIKY